MQPSQPKPDSVTDFPTRGLSSKEARGLERFTIRVKLELMILMPEDTFQPIQIMAVATEISQLGLRVKTPLLSRQQADRLHKGPAWVKLVLQSPKTGEEVVIKTRPFWARYYGETSKERAFTELGFSLKDLDEKNRILFEDLVVELTKGLKPKE